VRRLTFGFIAACGLALAVPYVAHAAVPQGQVPLDRFGNPIKGGSTITEFEFFFNTRGEAKDAAEPIDIQLLKGSTVIYDSGWIQGDVSYNVNTSHNWFAPWADKPVTVPVSTADCSSLKLRVEKQGDKPWTTNVRILGNSRSLLLLPDTADVQFGKKSATPVNDTLDAGGAKIQHTNGGNYHIFSFNCK
jgi:hypothetical protein